MPELVSHCAPDLVVAVATDRPPLSLRGGGAEGWGVLHASPTDDVLLSSGRCRVHYLISLATCRASFVGLQTAGWVFVVLLQFLENESSRRPFSMHDDPCDTACRVLSLLIVASTFFFLCLLF